MDLQASKISASMKGLSVPSVSDASEAVMYEIALLKGLVAESRAATIACASSVGTLYPRYCQYQFLLSRERSRGTHEV
jgi:hypothetical protein